MAGGCGWWPAARCAARGGGGHARPVADAALFHEKSGVVEDRVGHRLAWTGSLNETAAGWRRNWETLKR